MTALAPIHRVETPAGPRDLAEEVAVALVYNGATQAVLMATPADIADLARGFTLTEGLATAEEIGEVEVLAHDLGIEARVWLPAASAAALAARRRALVGAVGCGLCGIDSLEGAIRPLPRLPGGGPRISAAQASAALTALRGHQPLHDRSHAVHAAGLWRDGTILLAREDVGRHNALDKLIGAAAAAHIDAKACGVVLTSRLSVEMAQKTVMAGARVVVAASAPTAHALRIAEAAGLTLISAAGGAPRALAHAERFAP